LNNDHPWDAWSYDKVSSNVQLQWGRKLLDKRIWKGNEIAMDAGAGSGNLTKILANKVPQGQIYAVMLTLTWFSRQSQICLVAEMCKSSTQVWTK
jgi:hypothetical protein